MGELLGVHAVRWPSSGDVNLHYKCRGRGNEKNAESIECGKVQVEKRHTHLASLVF